MQALARYAGVVNTYAQPHHCNYHARPESYAEIRDRTGDLQIFSLTLSQLSYRGSAN